MLIRLISILLVSFLLAACDNSAFDIRGKISNNTYTNKYFNISLVLPENWHIAAKLEDEKTMEEGAKLISDGNILKKLQMKVSLMRTLNFFTSSKYQSPDQELSFSPSLMALGEQSSRYFFKMKNSEYLEGVKKGLIESKLPYKFLKPLSTKKLSDLSFGVLSATIEGEGYLKIYQDYYITNIRGYTLVFIMSYADDEDKKIMLRSLESLKRLSQ